MTCVVNVKDKTAFFSLLFDANLASLSFFPGFINTLVAEAL